MLHKRLEHSTDENPQWIDFIFEIILTYNNKLKHSSTNLTPDEARKNSNLLTVKLHIELHRKATTRYPPLEVGNLVKPAVHIKHKKEHISRFSENSYKILEIKEMHNQLYYKIDNNNKWYLRFELLKV